MCQSLDRGRKRIGSSGRARAPVGLRSPPPHLLPAHSVPVSENCAAGQSRCHFLAALAERSEPRDHWGREQSQEASGPRQSGSTVLMQNTSDPFPTLAWLSRGVGRDESGEGGWRLPPARRGNHSTVKDAFHPSPCHPGRKVRCEREKPPTPLTPANMRLARAHQSG